MPKVHADQKEKFEEEFFSKFHKDAELRYPLPKGVVEPAEKLSQLQRDMREGLCNVAFKGCGTNLPLRFPTAADGALPDRDCADFDKEKGKVHLRSQMILNGVCVQVVVALDLDTFDGVGHLEYDDELAKREEKMSNDVVDILPRPRPAFQPQSQGVNQPMWDQQPLPDTKPPHSF